MRAAAWCLIPLLAACAAKTPRPELPTPDHGQRPRTSTTASLGMYPASWGLPSRIVDTRTRAAIPLDQALDDLAGSKVIYVSESHNNPHHHAVQGAIITQLWRRDRRIAIGMEMFQRPFQQVIDRYLAGEIDEAAMLEATEYEDSWGYDFALYRSIAEFAKSHRVPIHALNARSEITKKVSREGLEALSPPEKAELPELDLGISAHRSMVAEAFEGHGMDPSRFDAFYAAQVIWDETMADTVASALANGTERIVVLAGGGHVRHGLGIPRRAARRGAKPFRTVIPVMLGDDQPALADLLDDPPGDYLWVMAIDGEDLPAMGPIEIDEDQGPTEVTRR